MLFHPDRSAPWSLALLTLAALAARSAAVAPEIKDEAKFFSPDAVKKANAEIREIMRKYGKDLLIETFPTVPEDQRDKVKAMSREEKAKFFESWARQRAEAAVVNGIYILICKDPPHLQVEVSPKVRSMFSKAARDKLIETLVTNFQNKEYDKGLQAAVQFVRERLAAETK
jgi:uncharacterized membrane protein YgcG